MRIAVLLAGLLLAAGCRAPLEGAPCPCVSGYECNAENVCVLVSSGGPDDDGDGDGEPDAAEGVPDAASDSGAPDAAEFPDSGGVPDASVPDASVPDASGGEPDATAAWYEQ